MPATNDNNPIKLIELVLNHPLLGLTYNAINQSGDGFILKMDAEANLLSFVRSEAGFLDSVLKANAAEHFVEMVHGAKYKNSIYFAICFRHGPSINECWSSMRDGKFTPGTVARIGFSVAKALEVVHRLGYLLRRTDPNIIKFDVGTRQIYLSNLSSVRLDPRKLKMQAQVKYAGASIYAPINHHQGKNYGAKHDLESLIYLLVEMTVGKLPWDGTAKEMIASVKKQTATTTNANDALFKGCSQYAELYTYITLLNESEPIDFSQIFTKQCIIFASFVVVLKLPVVWIQLEYAMHKWYKKNENADMAVCNGLCNTHYTITKKKNGKCEWCRRFKLRQAIENAAKAARSLLKNDFGLGSTTSKNVSSPTSNLIATSVSPAAPTRGTVEFVSDLHTNNSNDFHFGFNPESTVDESSFKSSNNAASGQNDFNRSRTHENDVYNKANVDSSSASKPLASAVSQLSNSYGIQPQQQYAPASQQHRRTTFGFAETSTVSYPPFTDQSSYAAHPQQVQQQPPIHQQHITQQHMYYGNLYNPVAGREDNPYAQGLYYGMDVNSMAQMLPMSMQPAVPSHHQQQQPAYRADHHQNFNEMNEAYGQTAAANPNASNPNAAGQRENIGSSNVPLPPGFSGPPANMFHGQHLQNMFHDPAAMYMPTPPPAQGTYGQQNSYAASDQMNSVLNSQKKPYHTGQWNS